MTDQLAFGLGSNIGDSRNHVESAAVSLQAEYPGARVSSLYITEPVGGPPQPDFLNAVVVAEVNGASEAAARAALQLAHRIEATHERTREVRWGPRTLDIDVLALGGLTVVSEDLVVPHPRAHLRAFVLVPWAELAPEVLIPGLGTVAQALGALPAVDRSSVQPL